MSPSIGVTSTWLLGASVAAVILVPAAWLACRLFKLAVAAARYQLWLYVLSAIVLLPVLRLNLPKVPVAVLPELGRVHQVAEAIGATTPLQVAGRVPEQSRVSTASHALSPGAARSAEVPWVTLLLAVWVAGFCWMLSRLVVGAVRLRGLRKRARVAPAQQVQALGLLPARLLFSDDIEGPATCGFFRPVIVLPSSVFDATDTEGVRMILEHECAHVRRKDHLAVVFQRLVEAALFFHPCVWYASRELTRQREFICDAHVVWSGRSALEYVRLLSRMIEHGWGSPSVETTALFEGNLVSRVRSLLESRGDRAPELPRRTRIVSATLGSILLLAFGTLRLEARADAITAPKAVPASQTSSTQPEKVTALDPIREEIRPLIRAILEYRTRQGRFPERLDVLGPTLPRDPYSSSGEGFHYEASRTFFVLGSCGPDGQWGGKDDLILYFTDDRNYQGRHYGTRAEMYPLPEVNADEQVEVLGPPGPHPKGSCSIAGRVVSAVDGKPVDTATVYLFNISTLTPAFVRVARDGSFRFEGIPAGEYSLRTVHTAGYQDSTYDPGGKEESPGFKLAEREDLTGIVLELNPAFSISGRVQGDDPAGLQVLALAERKRKPEGLEIVGQQSPGQDGAYQLDGLDGRPVYVMVADWRRTPSDGGYCPQYYPGTFSRDEAERIAFRKSPHVENVDIRLNREGGIVLQGTVRDENGQAVPGAYIVAHRSDMSFDFVPTYTDKTGHYLFSCLGKGDFLVHADAVQHNLVRTRTAVQVDGPASSSHLDFVLHRGVRIAGRLADEEGKEWTVGQGYGSATVASLPQEDSAFSVTGFENKNRTKNVRVPSGSTFSPGAGDYGSAEMIFPSESTFLLEGVPPGDTTILFEPKRDGKAVKRVLYKDRVITGAGLATKAGDEISDVIILIGDAR